MTLDPLADLDLIFNPEELATAAVLWPGEDRQRAIVGIYSETPQEGRLSEARVAGSRLILVCRSDQVADAGQGTPLRLEPNPRLGITGGDFRVAETQPAGPGKRLLVLQVRR